MALLLIVLVVPVFSVFEYVRTWARQRAHFNRYLHDNDVSLMHLITLDSG